MAMHQKLPSPEHVRHTEPLLMGTFCSSSIFRQFMLVLSHRQRQGTAGLLPQSTRSPHDTREVPLVHGCAPALSMLQAYTGCHVQHSLAHVCLGMQPMGKSEGQKFARALSCQWQLLEFQTARHSQPR